MYMYMYMLYLDITSFRSSCNKLTITTENNVFGAILKFMQLCTIQTIYLQRDEENGHKQRRHTIISMKNELSKCFATLQL